MQFGKEIYRHGIGYFNLGLIVFLSACSVGPEYHRPDVNIPKYVIGNEPGDSQKEVSWWKVTGDPDLIRLVDLVLSDNLTLKMAASRMDAAQAQVQLARSSLFPNLSYSGVYAFNKQPSALGPSPSLISGQVMPMLNWSPDFFGGTRRQIEAAEATLKGQEEGFRAASVLIVGQVAATYVQLRAAEEQLDMTRSVLARLNGELQEIKAASPPPAITITAPLETILVQLEAGIPLLQGVIEESENTIRLLCAKPDLQLKKNIALSQLHSPLMPKSISSEFIRRRPDVMQAEQILIAQNAMVGVAQSAYFPQLPLTIGRGIGLSALAAIPGSSVSGSVVAASASVMGPILDVGAVEANVSAAQAAKQEAILNYRNTLLKAYLDARTAIVRYNYSGQTVAAYEKALAANQTALGKVRDELKKDPAQVATMLALEQQEFVNRQSLITARVAQVNSLIQIYLSLGGPWIDVWARRGLAFYKDTASEATK